MKPQVIELDFVQAEGGGVLKVINRNSDHFYGFGELYLSRIDYGVFRGWKMHTRLESFLVVVEGEVSFHFVIEAGDCSTISVQRSVSSRVGLRIPAGVTFGFMAKSVDGATIANLAQLEHDPLESERFPGSFHECGWGS